MKNIINENDDYLNLLYTKMSEKKRLDDINTWIKKIEKNKYLYTNMKNKLNISGGIIIDGTNKWLKLFEHTKYTTLIITNNKFNNLSKKCIIYDYKSIKEIKNINWYRIIYDLDDIKNINNDLFDLQSKNKWIHISKNDNNTNTYYTFLKILLTDKNLHLPLYKNESLTEYELLEDYMTKLDDINQLVKINRIKYDLTELDKIIVKYVNYDKLDSIKLNNLLNKVTKTNTTCPICINNINNICITECNHIFCIDCILNWLSKKNTCPLCRTEINIEKLLIDIDKNIQKINILIERIKELLKLNKKIVIYTINKKYMLYIKLHINNIEQYDKNTVQSFINNKYGCMFIEPIYSYIIKNIHYITNIIIIDNEYKNILKRECLGYDLIYENKYIEIDIIEAN
jgi:hypothetical protein